MADSTFLYHAPCPAPTCHSSDGFGVYADGTGKCFVCDYRGPADDQPVQAPSSPAEALTPMSTGMGEPTIMALPDRRLSRETCRRYGYGYITERGGEKVQAAPYRDSTGAIQAVKVRRKCEKGDPRKFAWFGDKSLALPLFGQHLQSHGKRIVVTEGELDALSGSQALGNRWPVVSIPDGAVSAVVAVTAALGWLEGYDAVVFAFDQDDAGREASEACARLVTPGKAHIAVFPEGMKDASDMVVAGMEDQLKNLLWNAPRWAPSGIIPGPNILAAIRNRHKPAIGEWPFPKLQEMTRGIRSTEITLVVAPSGGGKSTLVRSCTKAWIDQGLTVGVVTLEETLDQYMIPLVGYFMGDNLRLWDKDPTVDSGFQEKLAGIQDRIIGYDDDGERDPDALMDRIRYMRMVGKADIVVLDHLTVVLGSAGDKNPNAFADRLMSNLEKLVKRTGVQLVLVTHLRKMGNDRKSHEQGAQITADDVRGSGLVHSLAHTIIARERNQQDPNDGGQLRLIKCRLSGTGRLGLADRTAFQESTGMIVTSAPMAALQPVTA